MEKDKKKKSGKNAKIKLATLSQILSLVLEIFAFSFIVGGMTLGVTTVATTAIPSVEAAGINDVILKGCCLEMRDGSICQTINMLDESRCKTGLISSVCENVDNCRVGCCYNNEQGSCSFNSPKQQCEQNGGNWSNNPQCDIQQCQLGCCLLGDQASITTSRECTRLSRELDFQRNFVSLDADGSCNSRTELNVKGACVKSTGDFSGENDCKFTTKEDCLRTSGDFYENYLCTAESLHTICKPSRETTCLEEKDQIYYLDDCGNPANIYDASRFSDQTYWEEVIPARDSSICSLVGADCGNCNYLTGSVCAAYRRGKDTRPTMGNNVCRNLNCLNGRKHGESWCIADYQNTESAGVSPIGSRWFMAKCLDGEITIEPCADFNQQICIENTDSQAAFTEAQCTVNDWRSCLAANQNENYDAIKSECSLYSQCAMFYDAEGQKEVEYNSISSDSRTSETSSLSDYGYATLPGFRIGVENIKQGAAGNVGKDNNKIIQWCFPKYSPGMIFWQDANTASITGGSSSSSSSSGTSSSGLSSSSNSVDYGGSYPETAAICGLGDFTCVSRQKRNCELGGENVFTRANCLTSSLDPNTAECDPWGDKENWECNVDGAHTTIKGTDLPKLMEAMNERCRMLGPCGSYVNVANELGAQAGFSVTREKIDEKGKSRINQNINAYVLSQNSLSKLKNKAGIIPAGSLSSLTAAVISIITGRETQNLQETTEQARSAVDNQYARERENWDTTASVAGTTLAAAGTVRTAAHFIAPAADAGAGGGAVGGQVTAKMTGATSATIGIRGSSPPPTTGASGWGAVGITIIASIAAYFIAKMIVKNQNWSPGKGAKWMAAITSTVAAVTMVALAIFAKSCVAGAGGGILGIAIGCIIGAVIAILMMIYTNCIDNKYDENQYYVINFKCEAWTPPQQGDCNSCNNDIRTCSEYRCRSLGLNCKYYNENGEPGWCAAITDTWSARITPWQDALTEGNSYTDITNQHFSIAGNVSSDGLVEPWQNLEFGIQTDKPAMCRIDNRHTSSFNDMAVEMFREAAPNSPQEAQGNINGLYHKIALSSYISTGNASQGTLPLVPGEENNYYIRCRNFAGLTNEAEFAVKIVVRSGPDLTPPNIKSFNPISGSYLAYGTNSTSMQLMVDEPAECKYSRGVSQRFEEMTGTMNCYTAQNMAVLGKWPCETTLENLTSGENRFYFACKDKPLSAERTVSERRITNENPKEYTLNACSTGLNITSVSPRGRIVAGKSPVAATLEVETSGCINGGISVCSYSLIDGFEIYFAETNSKQHRQVFDSLAAGDYNFTITCEDEAGNIARDSAAITVELDNIAPRVLRFFRAGENLNVVSDENAICRYTTNSSIGCTFDYSSNSSVLMLGTGKYHSAPWIINQDYFVKCGDSFGNQNFECAARIKTY